MFSCKLRLIKQYIHLTITYTSSTYCTYMLHALPLANILARVVSFAGKMDQSISHYLEAIKIDPAFADAYSNLGNAYKAAGNMDEAMICYNKAISLEPNYAEAYANLAAANKDAYK